MIIFGSVAIVGLAVLFGFVVAMELVNAGFIWINYNYLLASCWAAHSDEITSWWMRWKWQQKEKVA